MNTGRRETGDGRRRLIVGFGATGASVARHLTDQAVPFAVTDSRAQPPHAAQWPDWACVPHAFGKFACPVSLSELSEAVVSPGVSLDEPFVRELRAAGIPIVGDIELFARAVAVAPPASRLPPPVIAITGSNGKSTVTALVGAMARRAGLRVGVGGNFGEPALDLLDPAAQLYVLELSSFQLETTHSLRARAATMLNVSADHLDRHGNLDRYARAKARVFDGCEVAVANRDDPEVMRLAPKDAVTFGLGAPASGHYGLVEHEGAYWLAHGDSRLTQHASLRIHGLHNAANALAALALADAAGIPREASLKALTEFAGLPHRCQWVADVGGVSWYDDSKGTNVGATLAALAGMNGPIVWLGGGQGKGQDFSPLKPVLAIKGRAAILFGQDAQRIEAALAGSVPLYREPTLDESVRRARDVARPGDQVLLSPACASLDQFKNYIARGERFVACVRELAP